MQAKAISGRKSLSTCNVHGRSHAMRLRASSAAIQPSASTAIAYRRDRELQAALDDLFADTIDVGRTRLSKADVAHHVDRITELGRRLRLDVINPEWINGAFQGLVTTNMSGITEESVTSMARLTFGKVNPKDLAVQTGKAAAAGVPNAIDEYKGTLAGVPEAPDHGYSLVNYFQVLSNGVLGKMLVKGTYVKDGQDPARVDVNFIRFTLEPALTDERSLALWREALEAHNPGMGPTGAIDVELPEGKFRNYLRFVVMEPDLHMFVTGSGSFFVMKRAQA